VETNVVRETDDLKNAVAEFLGEDTRRPLQVGQVIPLTIGALGVIGALLLSIGNERSGLPQFLTQPTGTVTSGSVATDATQSITQNALAVEAKAVSRLPGQLVVWIDADRELVGVIIRVGGQTLTRNLQEGLTRVVFAVPAGTEVPWNVSLVEGSELAAGQTTVTTEPASIDSTSPTYAPPPSTNSVSPNPLPTSNFSPTANPSPTKTPSPSYPNKTIGPTAPIDPDNPD
jgi:hypothetical protein